MKVGEVEDVERYTYQHTSLRIENGEGGGDARMRDPMCQLSLPLFSLVSLFFPFCFLQGYLDP